MGWRKIRIVMEISGLTVQEMGLTDSCNVACTMFKKKNNNKIYVTKLLSVQHDL